MNSTRGKTQAGYYALLIFAVFVASSAVIMIKASKIHPILQASYRQVVAGIFLLPFYFRELKKHGERPSWKLLSPSVLPGIILGVHFITWITGARLTLAGNATVIVNLIPIVMPFMAYFMIKEKPGKAEVLGTIISVVGLAFLAVSDFKLEGTHFLGDAICFGSMILYAVYLLLGKRNNPSGRFLTYLVPLYWIGGIFCFIVALPFAHPFRGLTATDILMTIGLGLGPTVIGHTIINFSMKRLPSQVVSLMNVFQFLTAGILAYIIYREVPGWEFYVTSSFIVAGAAIAIFLPGKKKA